VAQVEAALGPIDILINNAALGMGVIREEHFAQRVGIAEVAPEQWRAFFEVNTMGPFLMTRLLAPAMATRGWGRVVNITTSFFTMLNQGFAPYGPTKAALEASTAIWAKEFADTGVAINVVVPGGPTDTRMVPQSLTESRDALIPVAAMVGPVQWLASRLSDGVTGQRFIGALWDADLAPAEAAAAAGAPAAWPDLAANIVWPGV
jgi:NAD(P)-dependent dehydrogenase (short-subunit alcohol dehydrogenase family)